MPEKMIRCPDGHFYDPSKHETCPWCALPGDMTGMHTQALRTTPPPLPGSAPVTAPAFAAAPPAPQAGPALTRRVSATPGKPEPVVGWLVCIEGPDRGRDFRLHAEKNFIGRSSDMDVCIPGDETVSRDKHGIVIFDPRKSVFWTLPGDSAGLVYLNGEVVHAPTQLKQDDVLELGRTKLVLIAFCGEKYQWGAAAPASPSA